MRTEGIGIQDDFFDLGGQSMTAVGLVARLRALFNINLEIALLFERPTIAGLSEAIDMLVITNQSTSPSSGAREEFNL
ncbi:phosphopantetheine-binding protein [Bradyrhizobium symbiodeficiens]|uniref:phosphopantetheine-binding protein n=1 Tax=Bradyrhizobium symbiodeficiens TaxID=1404367 RepID=UPI002FE59A30